MDGDAQLSCPTVKNGTHNIGPENGSLQVKTYRAGMAQKAGHDLVIDVTSWSATVTVEGDSPATVELNADPRSLHVNEGHGGAKALSDKDKADIRESVDDKVLKGEAITFRSTSASSKDPGSVSMDGELGMAGTTRPVSFEVEISPDGQVKANVALTQSEWGIKPFKAMMGALKVKDEVDVVLDARLPSE